MGFPFASDQRLETRSLKSIKRCRQELKPANKVPAPPKCGRGASDPAYPDRALLRLSSGSPKPTHGIRGASIALIFGRLPSSAAQNRQRSPATFGSITGELSSAAHRESSTSCFSPGGRLRIGTSADFGLSHHSGILPQPPAADADRLGHERQDLPCRRLALGARVRHQPWDRHRR